MGKLNAELNRIRHLFNNSTFLRSFGTYADWGIKTQEQHSQQKKHKRDGIKLGI
jgi:hypothetical protein